MTLVVSQAAAADFERLRNFLSEQSSSAAKRAIGSLDAAISSLEIFPGRGRPSGIPGVRELVVRFGASAYLLRYAHLARSDTVVILRIWHTAARHAEPRALAPHRAQRCAALSSTWWSG